MKPYTQTAFEFIMQNHYITHKIIQTITHCNDSYSIMQSIKKKLKAKDIQLFEKPMKNPNTNSSFTHYYIEVA